ncbi:MAG: hypothetical protein A2231_02825 [Candidatus Firestonebacteria bacterium RIFOXYA2_FULL_40_8]|nr:MAG: hypothetical protein A2231_02825 [Candidatus Firestonebacteria bacterium RIFOXYA2_FULL_40_8]
MKVIKNIILSILAFAVCSAVQLQAEIKTLVLLKIDKGEMCTADEGDLAVSMSKEKAAEGKKYCIKVSISKTSLKPYIFIITNDSNLLKGKRGDWSDYDTLKIPYFSTNKAAVETDLHIGDEVAYARWSDKKQCIKKVTLLPGQNVLTVDIKKLERTNFKGQFFDMDKIRGCFFKSDNLTSDDWVLFIQDVYLEKK